MAWVHPPAIGCRFSFLHLPCGRCGHTMNVHSDHLIIFGGYDGKKWLNDLYEFNTHSLVWSQPSMLGSAPQPRQYHASAIIKSNLYIYGGYNGSAWLKDLVIADLSQFVWKTPQTHGSQPSAKEGLAMAAIGNLLYVHGGWNGTPNGELHRLDTLTLEWFLIRLTGPRPQLCGHSMTVVKERLFLFGGFDGAIWKNDLYTIDPVKENSWTEPVVFGTPVARGYHSAVLFNKHILVYAGYNGKYILADIVALDIETLTWFLPDTCSGHFPAARNAHTMALHGSQLYLFGGYNGSRDTNELHILETSAFSSLHEDFKNVLTYTKWQDVKLYTQSASVRVHVLILKVRAPLLFAQVMKANPELISNGGKGRLNLVNGGQECLRLFCEYLYCDLNREKISVEVAEELMYLAFKYSLERLKALCLKVVHEGSESLPESSLAADIMKCKDEAGLSDFVINVKDKSFRVHRVVLAARCQYFRAFLNSGMKDSQESVISFNDLDPKAFEIIIEWMYSDKFLPLFAENSLGLEVGKELLSATNFLQLDSLMRITEITLWKLINDSNAFRMFEIACLFSTSQLKSYCVNYILRQFDKSFIQRELSGLSSDAAEELCRFLPKRAKKLSYLAGNDLVHVKYEREEEELSNEPVMVSGRLFESLRITKKMTIKADSTSISKDFFNAATISQNLTLRSSFKSPISLKFKPRLQLNIRGIKAGGPISMQEPTEKGIKTYKRKPKSYKSLTQVGRAEIRSSDKPDFFIKGFGSSKRGKSRMNSLVNCSRAREILGTAGFQIYSSVDMLTKHLTLPEIKF